MTTAEDKPALTASTNMGYSLEQNVGGPQEGVTPALFLGQEFPSTVPEEGKDSEYRRVITGAMMNKWTSRLLK